MIHKTVIWPMLSFIRAFIRINHIKFYECLLELSIIRRTISEWEQPNYKHRKRITENRFSFSYCIRWCYLFLRNLLNTSWCIYLCWWNLYLLRVCKTNSWNLYIKENSHYCSVLCITHLYVQFSKHAFNEQLHNSIIF